MEGVRGTGLRLREARAAPTDHLRGKYGDDSGGGGVQEGKGGRVRKKC